MSSVPLPYHFGERFQLRGRLGEGGMGVVYHAFDRHREIDVALKRLSRADPGGIQRLKKEFRSLVDTMHPNLVRFYDFFGEGDDWFFTMELVRGTDFLSFVRGEAVAPGDETITRSHETNADTLVSVRVDSREVARGFSAALVPADAAFAERALRPVLRQLASGIVAIHRAGKLHRDLKPSNVLVTPEGRVVLLDFGLTADISERTAGPSQDNISGTPGYMSPEQAIGLSATPASDWYAFGAMLYEVLAGALPFEGSAVQVLVAKQVEEPPPLIERAPEAPVDLADLAMDLLRREPALRADARRVDQVLGFLDAEPSAPAASTRRPSEGAPFVGRTRDLAGLRAAFGDCRTLGVPFVFSLLGTSGYGKSRLLRKFLGDIEAVSALVLQGRCYEREAVPFKAFDPLIDSLSDFLHGLDAEDRAALLPADFAILSRLFPVLREIDRSTLDEDTMDLAEVRRRAFEALRALLAALSERGPVVLAIDDAQWSDSDSARLARALLEGPAPPPIFVVVSCRTEAAQSCGMIQSLRALSLETWRSVRFAEHMLEPLAPAESHRLALELLGGDGPERLMLAERVAAESQGSPLFVGELARYSSERPSGHPDVSLDEAFAARLSVLDEALLRFIEIIALSAGPLPERVVADAAGLSAEERAGLHALRIAALVRAARDRSGEELVDIYHDRIREVAVARLSGEARRDRHLSLAKALERSNAADPEVLSFHWAGAGDAHRAAEAAARGARHAMRTLAFDRAARLFERALELDGDGTDRLALTENLADALVSAGRSASAAEAYLSAAALASGSDVLDLEKKAAEQFFRSGLIQRGLDVVPRVLSKVGLGFPSSGAEALAHLAFYRARLATRGLGFTERPAAAHSTEELARIDTCWLVALGMSTIDNVRGTGFQARHLLWALDAGEPYRVCRALAMEAGYLGTAGGKRLARAERVAGMAASLAARVNEPHARGLADLCAGLVAAESGQWVRALERCDAAEAILRNECKGVSWEIGTAVRFSVMSLYYLGRIREVRARAQAQLAESLDRGDAYSATLLRVGIPNISRLADDDPLAVRSEVSEAMAAWSGPGFQLPSFFELNSLVHADLYAGEGARAHERIGRAWPRLRASHSLRIQLIRILCWNMRAKAALARALDEPGRASGLIASALADAKRIERERITWATPLATLVRAGAEMVRGRRTSAFRVGSKAASEFRSADMLLMAVATEWACGMKFSGDTSSVGAAAADAALRAEGIQCPERWVRMLVATL